MSVVAQIVNWFREGARSVSLGDVRDRISEKHCAALADAVDEKFGMVELKRSAEDLNETNALIDALEKKLRCPVCGSIKPKADRAHVMYGGENDFRTCIPKEHAAELMMRDPKSVQYGGAPTEKSR